MSMKTIKNSNLKLLITFSPLLILYALIVIFFQRDFINADELRYITYAKNLVNGTYAPDGSIVNGPGYPIVLYLFELFRVNVIFPRLLNALFLYLSIFFISKTLLFFTNYKKTIIISVLIGLYYPFFKPLSLAMTEIITVMVICIIQYMVISYYRTDKYKLQHLIGASLFLSFLAMIKIIFGYVILTSLIISLVIFLFKKSDRKIMVGFVKIFALALLFCIPYLTYTYNLTKEVFYWGRPGNDSFYWMTSTDDAEYGDYYSNAPMDLQVWRNKEFGQYNEQFIKNHKAVMDKVSTLPPLQADSVWKTEAINNIKKRPTKYLINCFSNLGRILFSYPHSYRYMNLTPYYYFIPNMFLVVFFLLFLYPAIRYFKKILIEIRIFLMFIIIYLGASILVSADVRMIFPIIPQLQSTLHLCLLIWLVYL
jgi:hypothetical protein